MSAPHTASDPNRRTKVLLVVGLVVILLALVGSRMLSGGEAGPGTASSTPPSATASAPLVDAPATAGAAAGTPAAPAVETFEVFTTKNPFLALRTAAVAPAAPTVPGAAPAPAAPVAAAPAAPAPAAPAAPAPAAPAAPAPAASAVTTVASTTATGNQTTESVRTTRVALLDVFTEGDRVVANVRVNDTVSKVGVGDSFSGSFKVVSLDLDTRCGRFLYGDDQFRLCRGEELLK